MLFDDLSNLAANQICEVSPFKAASHGKCEKRLTNLDHRAMPKLNLLVCNSTQSPSTGIVTPERA